SQGERLCATVVDDELFCFDPSSQTWERVGKIETSRPQFLLSGPHQLIVADGYYRIWIFRKEEQVWKKISLSAYLYQQVQSLEVVGNNLYSLNSDGGIYKYPLEDRLCDSPIQVKEKKHDLFQPGFFKFLGIFQTEGKIKTVDQNLCSFTLERRGIFSNSEERILIRNDVNPATWPDAEAIKPGNRVRIGLSHL